jgi:hypothetical protein
MQCRALKLAKQYSFCCERQEMLTLYLVKKRHGRLRRGLEDKDQLDATKMVVY